MDAARELSREEIRERLLKYDPESLGRVSSYVGEDLKRQIDRGGAIDTKANIVLGFATAAVSVVASWLVKPASPLPLYFRGLAGLGVVVCMAAVPFAFFAMAARRSWPRLPGDSVFPVFSGDDDAPHRHQLYWTVTLYRMASIARSIADEKGYNLLRAQRALVVGVGILAFAVVAQVIDAGRLPATKTTAAETAAEATAERSTAGRRPAGYDSGGAADLEWRTGS